MNPSRFVIRCIWAAWVIIDILCDAAYYVLPQFVESNFPIISQLSTKYNWMSKLAMYCPKLSLISLIIGVIWLIMTFFVNDLKFRFPVTLIIIGIIYFFI